MNKENKGDGLKSLFQFDCFTPPENCAVDLPKSKATNKLFDFPFKCERHNVC